MINENKWIDSLPKAYTTRKEKIIDLDHDKWISTIPNRNTYSSVKKYSFIFCLFVCGLIFVSLIKNETRNLEKEINNLETSIKVIKFNLSQAILDNEVIKSPENISHLAKKYLDDEFSPYKRSQIRMLNDLEKDIKIMESSKKKINGTSLYVKSQLEKNIKQKKQEIAKLKVLYSNPDRIPNEIKTKVTKEIQEKKSEIETMYRTPNFF